MFFSLIMSFARVLWVCMGGIILRNVEASVIQQYLDDVISSSSSAAVWPPVSSWQNRGSDPSRTCALFLLALRSRAFGVQNRLVARHTNSRQYRHFNSQLPSRRGSLECCDTEVKETNLTACGGVRKLLLKSTASSTRGKPPWGALVEMVYTARLENGTIIESSNDTSFEFQLNTNALQCEGLEIGVRSLRPGDVAKLVISPDFVWIDQYERRESDVIVDVEMLNWKEGPEIDMSQEYFDIGMYKNDLLKSRDARSGNTSMYRWSEGGQEMKLWIPLEKGERSRDITCDFKMNSMRVVIKGADGKKRIEIGGALRGRTKPDGCYWEIENEDDTRSLYISLQKKGEYSKWDGVLREEDGTLDVKSVNLGSPDFENPITRDMFDQIQSGAAEGFTDLETAIRKRANLTNETDVQEQPVWSKNGSLSIQSILQASEFFGHIQKPPGVEIRNISALGSPAWLATLKENTKFDGVRTKRMSFDPNAPSDCEYLENKPGRKARINSAVAHAHTLEWAWRWWNSLDEVERSKVVATHGQR